MAERYTVQARISRKARSAGERFSFDEGDVVTGDQLRALGVDVERLLVTQHIAPCRDKPASKADSGAPDFPPPDAPRPDAAPGIAPNGRGRVSDG